MRIEAMLSILLCCLPLCLFAVDVDRPWKDECDIDWKQTGSGAGGNAFGVFCAPSNPNIVYATPDVGGLYRSDDGGKSFVRQASQVFAETRSRFNPDFICIAPSDPNIVFITIPHAYWTFWRGGVMGGNHSPAETSLLELYNGESGAGLAKTEDGGKTWSLLRGTPEMGGPMAIDPMNPQTLWGAFPGKQNHKNVSLSEKDIYYGTWDPNKAAGAVGYSEDGGKTWKYVHVACSDNKEAAEKKVFFLDLKILPNSPYNKRTLLVSGNHGIWKSQDHGRTWSDISGNLPTRQVQHFDIHDKQGKTLLVATLPSTSEYKGGVFKSNGNGQWIDITGNLYELDIKLRQGMGYVRISRQNPQIIYATAAVAPTREPGVFKTEDGGKTWKSIFCAWHKDKTKINFDPAQSWNTSVRYAGIPEGFDMSEADDRVLYLNDGGCMMSKSVDGGQTWQVISSYKVGENRWQSSGYESAYAVEIAFDPEDEQRIYVNEHDFTLHTSDDKGKTWLHNFRKDVTRQASFSEERATNGYHVAVSPSPPHNVYAISRYWWPADVFFAKSADKGKTWQIQSKGFIDMPPNPLKDKRFLPLPTSLLVLSDGRVLVSANTGLYESADEGLTWTRLKVGIPKDSTFKFKKLYQCPGKPEIIFAIAGGFWRRDDGANGKCDHTYPAAFLTSDLDEAPLGGLWRSDDMGRNWRQIANDLRFQNASALGVTDGGQTLYLGVHCWGDNQNNSKYRFYPGALFKSTDAGKTWNKLLTCRNRTEGKFNCIAINSVTPQIVYVTCTERLFALPFAEILRSLDGGQTFAPILGNAAHQSYLDLKLNPHSPNEIWVGTGGAFLFHGVDPTAGKIMRETSKK